MHSYANSLQWWLHNFRYYICGLVLRVICAVSTRKIFALYRFAALAFTAALRATRTGLRRWPLVPAVKQQTQSSVNCPQIIPSTARHIIVKLPNSTSFISNPFF